MITVASHEARTILGRLDTGVDILDGLREVCRLRQVRTGTVVALGALRSAVVTHYDPVTRQYGPGRTLLGPLEILSAVGNFSESGGELSVHLHITVSREGDNGIEVLGGHVVSGDVFACEFSITALDDVMLRRSEDEATGLNLWQEGFEREDAPATGTPMAELGRVDSGSSVAEEVDPNPEPEPAPTPKAKPKAKAKAKSKGAAAKTPPKSESSEMSWADVAAASQIAQAKSPLEPAVLPPKPRPPQLDEDDDEEEVDDELDFLEVEPGDIVEHPKFKRCKVARVEGDMEYVQVRLRNGNLVRLSLDIVRLVLVGSEDGHQVFKAIIDV